MGRLDTQRAKSDLRAADEISNISLQLNNDHCHSSMYCMTKDIVFARNKDGMAGGLYVYPAYAWHKEGKIWS